jgi:hypothetical protein
VPIASAQTLNKRQSVSITKIGFLTLYAEIITAYFEHNWKPVSTVLGKTHNYLIMKQVVHSYDSVSELKQTFPCA